MFVHRIVANVVVHSDLNCLSAIQFAVDVLRVSDIIVCGHYGCGGVLAALRDDKLGLIDNWLRHVQDVRWRHQAQLAALETEAQQHDRLLPNSHPLFLSVHQGRCLFVQRIPARRSSSKVLHAPSMPS